jgi:hypothetical protein
MFYVEDRTDLYGWYMTAKEQQLSTAFFMIERFYVNGTPVLYRSTQDDVYEPWSIDYPPTKNIIRCPIPEAISHELGRIQSKFVQEWLFFQSDPHIASELAAYRAHGLPVQVANIKYKKLTRMNKGNGSWIHATPGTDFNVAFFLEKHWRHEEKVPVRSKTAQFSYAAAFRS